MSRPTSTWKDPVKGMPAKASTMNTRGDFEAFTDLMKRVVNSSTEDDPKSSSSPSPAAS
jgi:hypothetical protein